MKNSKEIKSVREYYTDELGNKFFIGISNNFDAFITEVHIKDNGFLNGKDLNEKILTVFDNSKEFHNQMFELGFVQNCMGLFLISSNKHKLLYPSKTIK